jgi:hypothetical protein
MVIPRLARRRYVKTPSWTEDASTDMTLRV